MSYNIDSRYIILKYLDSLQLQIHVDSESGMAR